MASRQSAHVSQRIPQDGGEPPNQFRDVITIDMRVFWPPYTTDKRQLVQMIADATAELLRQVIGSEPPPPKMWLGQPIDGHHTTSDDPRHEPVD